MIAIRVSAPRREVMRQLCRRIFDLIREHPEIEEMPAADCLLQFPEFEFLDLKPTLREVALAFETAVGAWKMLESLKR